MDAVVRTSQKPADIPGNPFYKISPLARDITYYHVYVNDEPIAQVALLRKGGNWWIDYYFIRKDMRGKNIAFPALLNSSILDDAVKKTDYLLLNCQGVTPEDVQRHRKTRDTPPSDILRSGRLKDGRPFTLIRLHISSLRKQAEQCM